MEIIEPGAVSSVMRMQGQRLTVGDPQQALNLFPQMSRQRTHICVAVLIHCEGAHQAGLNMLICTCMTASVHGCLSLPHKHRDRWNHAQMRVRYADKQVTVQKKLCSMMLTAMLPKGLVLSLNTPEYY